MANLLAALVGDRKPYHLGPIDIDNLAGDLGAGRNLCQRCHGRSPALRAPIMAEMFLDGCW
ncbi:MAG: hypothetical protein ACFCVB_18495 [Nodosilinea sp.]